MSSVQRHPPHGHRGGDGAAAPPRTSTERLRGRLVRPKARVACSAETYPSMGAFTDAAVEAFVARIRNERVASGLPQTITDEAILDNIAAMVLMWGRRRR